MFICVPLLEQIDDATKQYIGHVRRTTHHSHRTEHWDKELQSVNSRDSKGSNSYMNIMSGVPYPQELDNNDDDNDEEEEEEEDDEC